MVIFRALREPRYGMGVVERLARNSGYSKTALYYWRNAYVLLRRQFGAFAFRQFEAQWPTLTYSHLKYAIDMGQDFEDIIDWLMEAQGFNEPPDPLVLKHEITVPMTVDAFEFYLKLKTGKVKGEGSWEKVYDQTGEGWQVLQTIRQFTQSPGRFRVVLYKDSPPEKGA
jgi:hypothetical protein